MNYASGDAQDMAHAMQLALRSTNDSQAIADANREASKGFPFSEVIDFHMQKLGAASKRKRLFRGINLRREPA